MLIAQLGYCQFPAVVTQANLGNSGLRIKGYQLNEQLGHSIANAGDFNDDGYEDLVISAVGSDRFYIVYGDDSLSGVFNLSSIDSSSGLIIEYPGQLLSSVNQRERFVSAAGDINGDGVADVLLSPPPFRDSVRVLFGRDSTWSTFEIDSMAAGDGIIFNREMSSTYPHNFGYSVAGGDFNGDGVDDVITADVKADYFAQDGRAYLVFGDSSMSHYFEMDSLTPSTGMVINEEAGNNWFSWAMSNAGDFNGDGIKDMLISADLAEVNGVPHTGIVYLVYGSTSFPDTLHLNSFSSSDGVVLTGESVGGVGQAVGISVGGGGDINGDGFSDIFMGSSSFPVPSAGSGKIFVAFGGSSLNDTIDLSNLNGTNGFTASGLGAYHSFGFSSEFVGDLNNDGFGDLVVGARMQLNPYLSGPVGAGAAYVIFGRDSFSSSINVTSLNGNNGFKFAGNTTGDWAGHCVRGNIDFNNDGISDLVVGIPKEDQSGASEAGEVVVVFGRDCASTLDSLVVNSPPSCPGSSRNLDIHGNIGSGGIWNVRKDSCNGVIINQTSSSSIALFPTETTTYYVSSDTACLGSVACMPITIEVLPSSIDSISIDACSSYTVPSGANTYTESGVIWDTLSNASGCDSVFMIDLVVHPAFTDTVEITTCEPYVAPSGNSLSQTGFYVDSLSTLNGCDSLFYIDLVIDELMNTVVQVDSMFIATNSNIQNDWYFCDSLGMLDSFTGVSSDTFVAAASGYFTLVFSDSICSDTSECFYFESANGISKEWVSSGFSVYPNPINGEFKVDLKSINQTIQLKVYNSFGQVVSEETWNNTSLITSRIEGSSGVYFLEIQIESQKPSLVRLIKQ